MHATFLAMFVFVICRKAVSGCAYLNYIQDTYCPIHTTRDAETYKKGGCKTRKGAHFLIKTAMSKIKISNQERCKKRML